MTSVTLVIAAALAMLLLTPHSEGSDQRVTPGTVAWSQTNPPIGSVDEIIANNNAHEVVVAVLDSGIDYEHPALRRNMHFNLDEVVPYLRSGRFGRDEDGNGIADDFLGYDFTGDDGFPSHRLVSPELGVRVIMNEIFEVTGHGTHVAGIVAQNDPRIGIMPFRIIPPPPGAETVKEAITQTADIMKNAIYMAKRGGARVVNMSLGVMPSPYASEHLIKNAFKELQRYVEKAAGNVLIVVAAGNDTTDVSAGTKVMPCQLRAGNVLCVGSVNAKNELSEFSNLGIQYVDLFAPGEDIVSTMPTDHTQDGQGYESKSGTSMAAPYVAHVSARVLIKNPCLTADQVANVLLDTATRHKAAVRLGNSKTEEFRYRVVDLKAAERRAVLTECW